MKTTHDDIITDLRALCTTWSEITDNDGISEDWANALHAAADELEERLDGYEVTEDPETFEHGGLVWKRHDPDEPMPCGPRTKVRMVLRGEEDRLSELFHHGYPAGELAWGDKGDDTIIGWHEV